MHKLISITALYHLDTDAGLRVTVTDENNTLDTLDAFHQVIVEKYDELWADAITQFKHQELLDVFRHKLSQIAQRKPPTKRRLATIAGIMGAVYLMEKHGYLRTDHFNGLQLEYAPLN